ncbi:phage tail protein [Agaribacter flavus]|uniref:Phage tail protein n=1 Tax=Agaribacter flavus TaxID=1902781 RepID=A0ABV7FPK3_9ALTE
MNIKKHLTCASIFTIALTTILLSSKSYACSSSPYIGGMCAFGGNYSIRGWLKTDGQLLPISSNTALFSILGTTYGGDGRTTFALPDLRGRSAIGSGRGPGLLDYRLGQKGGAETHILTQAQLAGHTHGAVTTVSSVANDSGSSAVLRALAASADTNVPTGAVLANSPAREEIYSSGVPNVDMDSSAIDLSLNVQVNSTATTTISTTGNSSAFNVRGPYLTVTWLIATQGLFPPRN